MSSIYWDTMLFAYWLEGAPEFADRVGEIHSNMMRRGDRLFTSSFTMGELLVRPLRDGASDQVRVMRDFLKGPSVTLIDFDATTAERFAQIRATTSARPADAIHLACAAIRGVDLFITNDSSLRDLVIPGINFIAGLDVNVL